MTGGRAPVTKSDRVRWDTRYASGDRRHDEAPVPLLAAWVPGLRPGRALDVAAGLGRHALLLARYGWTVDAVDISFEGLRILKRRAELAGLRVNVVVADLDQFVAPSASYDLIVQTFFLERSLLPRFRRWLKPGGLVYVETHLIGPGAPGHGRFALREGELRQLFRTWQILAFEEGGQVEGDHQTATARLLARRPGKGHTPVRI